MEETKDNSESIAERIVLSLSYNPEKNLSISKKAAVEVLYPQLAKLKTEVRLRSTDNWLN